MYHYSNATHSLTWSYNNGRGRFSLVVPAFMGVWAGTKAPTQKEVKKLFSIIDLSDDYNKPLLAFPFYYHAKRKIDILRHERENVTARYKGTPKLEPKLKTIHNSINKYIKLSSLFSVYGYPALADGNPAENINDWLWSMVPAGAFPAYQAAPEATWIKLWQLRAGDYYGKFEKTMCSSVTKIPGQFVVGNDYLGRILDEADKRDNVRAWYQAAFPDDDISADIDGNVTFLDLYRCIMTGRLFYKKLGTADSVLRERVFDRLCELSGRSYDDIYDDWLIKYADKHTRSINLLKNKVVKRPTKAS